MSSVGFGAKEATISTTSPNAWARALARPNEARDARPTFGPNVAEATMPRTASETFSTSALVAGVLSWGVGPWAAGTFGVGLARPRAALDGRSLPLTKPIRPGG